MRKGGIWYAACAPLFVLACSSVSAAQDKTAADALESVVPRVVSASMPWNAGWTAEASPAGGLWLAWYADLPELNLTRPDGSTVPLVGGDDPEQAPSGLSLLVEQGGAWVAYRNKLPERALYVRKEGEKEIAPVGVSGETMPLARFSLHPSKDGLEALWYGEQQIAGQPLHNIFLRKLSREGEPQGAPERILPGIYPVRISDAEGHAGVFSWVKDAQGSRIAVRSRRAGEDSFGATTVVRTTTDSVTLPFNAFSSGGRWFVYWVAQHGKLMDEFLVEGAWSDDQGASWSPFDLTELRGHGVETIETAANGREIVLALGIAPRGHARSAFREVWIVRSEDNGASWQTAQTVRAVEAGYAIAKAPKVAFLADSRLVVVWEDWREIRSRIRYSLSEDGGRTWAVRDGRLPVRDEKSVLLHFFSKALIPDGKGGLHLIAEEMTDQYLRKELLQYDVSATQLLRPVAPPEPTLIGLEERISAYWTALINADYKAAFDEIDPFFRARVPFSEYLQAAGRIKYEAFKIKEVRQEGHLAHVRQIVTASVPPFFNKGKLVEVPKMERPIDTTWLWVDGRWVFQYKSDARAEYNFARY